MTVALTSKSFLNFTFFGALAVVVDDTDVGGAALTLAVTFPVPAAYCVSPGYDAVSACAPPRSRGGSAMVAWPLPSRGPDPMTVAPP